MNNAARQARLAAGLTIGQVSKGIGISVGFLSDIENGHRKVGAEHAQRIASLYGVSVESIFTPQRYAAREVEQTPA